MYGATGLRKGGNFKIFASEKFLILFFIINEVLTLVIVIPPVEKEVIEIR